MTERDRASLCRAELTARAHAIRRKIRIWPARDAALRLQGASPIVNNWTIRAYQLVSRCAYRWIIVEHVLSYF